MGLAGKDAIFYVLKDDVLTPIVCATTGVLSVRQSVKAATKQPNSRWEQYYADRLGYEITVDGICMPTGEMVNSTDLYAMMVTGSSIMWMMMDAYHSEYFFTGYIIPTSITFTSPAVGHHSFSFSAVGDGEISTNNPYQTNFIQLDNFFGVESNEFLIEKTIDGDFPEYK